MRSLDPRQAISARHRTLREELSNLDPLGALWQLVNFLLPAFLLGAVAAALAKLAWRRELARAAWWRLARDAALACTLVLVAGIVITGHDGRMATYAAMVVACAVTLGWRMSGPGRR
jgi:hypothetical protein